MSTFIPAGGSDVVLSWLYGLASPEVRLWNALDDGLRLCLAQGWLLGTNRAHHEHREQRAHALSQASSPDPDFPTMLADLTQHWAGVYADLEGRPCLVGVTDLVDLDMELVVVTSQEFVGEFEAGDQIPTHSFITRWVAGDWRIAATARRLPEPGWPPTERTVPGLLA